MTSLDAGEEYTLFDISMIIRRIYRMRKMKSCVALRPMMNGVLSDKNQREREREGKRERRKAGLAAGLSVMPTRSVVSIDRVPSQSSALKTILKYLFTDTQRANFMEAHASRAARHVAPSIVGIV